MTTQAYFENIQPEIVRELKGALHSIFVAVAWFTDDELLAILSQKAASNVSVSVLILNDEINTGNTGIDFSKLINAGGKVHFIGSRDEMMHNKFCVIDRDTIITGSYNWTRKAKSNDENITITKESRDLATDFIQEFNRLLKKYTCEIPTIDLQTLLKRLEILRNTIGLQDPEDIQYQSGKLSKLVPSNEFEEVDAVLAAINRKQFGEAARIISAFLSKYQSLTIWTDPELQGLQLEIRSLSLQLNSLEDEFAEIEHTLREFEVRHARELGAIILQILELKRKIAEKTLAEDPDDATAQKEYKEAKEDEEQYRGDYQQTQKIVLPVLSKEEEQELKKLYRKISKLTHPDIVDKQFEQDAKELFIKARQAVDSNDIQTLIEILAYLESGKPFKMKHEISETEILKKEAIRLRQLIEATIQKIASIKDSGDYQTITTIEDWDEYFVETKEKLESELEYLQSQIDDGRE